MNRARKIIHAEEAWRYGLTGKGITAAVLDTGVSGHPDYSPRLLCFRDLVNGRLGAYDDYGHGTHVTGILAGNGKMASAYRGVAPEASIVHIKVLDQNGNGKREDVINGIRWVIRHRHQYAIRILNISVGTVKEGDLRDEKLVEAVEDAWDAGLVVVVAAGNMGPLPQSITAPGNSRKVITVGSSDEAGPVYSGRGPTKSCICKPDIVAPGSNITSCSTLWQKGGRPYCQKSGTSMATPMVSGAAALLLSKEPWLTNVEIKMRLRESATDLGLEHSRQGWGLLNIKRFCRLMG
ncbi:MAG: S8 family peptidase [Eubacteriales bacterium]|nr:S8 family peptidase [Eubacteriales bacterium]